MAIDIPREWLNKKWKSVKDGFCVNQVWYEKADTNALWQVENIQEYKKNLYIWSWVKHKNNLNYTFCIIIVNEHHFDGIVSNNTKLPNYQTLSLVVW